jgi:hypothetical protein
VAAVALARIASLGAGVASLGLAGLALLGGLAALLDRLAALLSGLAVLLGGLAARLAASGRASGLRNRDATVYRVAGVAAGKRLAALCVLRTALLGFRFATRLATTVMLGGIDNIVFAIRHKYVYLVLIENLLLG